MNTNSFIVPLNVTPLNGNVIVRPKKQSEMTSGGIIIPDASSGRAPVLHGYVLAVGEGKMLKNGERAKTFVKVGDEVIYGKYSGQEIVVDNEEVLIMEEYGIFAIVD